MSQPNAYTTNSISALEARAVRLSDGHAHVYYVAISSDGKPTEPLEATLLSLIEMSCWGDDSLRQLEDLVRAYEMGDYQSPNHDLPDYSFNDVCIWLNRSKSPPGFVCMTNENTEYTFETSGAQAVELALFWRALAAFKALISNWKEIGAKSLLETPVRVSI